MALKILAIDIGGTGLKASVVDETGTMLVEKRHVPTPHPCSPDQMIDALVDLTAPFRGYSRIAIGFPGVVRDNRVVTAPHFDGPDWAGFELADRLSARLGGKKARMINDAEMQGLAVISGRGLELVLTLGTGAGTALFRDGERMPHMELAHHPIHKDKTYNEYIGDPVRKKIGRKRWQRNVLRTIDILYSLLHFDRLYIGGGNSIRLDDPLPPNVARVSNEAGIDGGAFVWNRKRPD